MENNFTPGCHIYLVERDEGGYPVGVTGHMFVTDVLEYAILTAYINNLKTIRETLEYHEEECRENYETDLVVAKLSDCYPEREYAEEAMKEELRECDD
jgi:hypothetical protein